LMTEIKSSGRTVVLQLNDMEYFLDY